jgi:predicted dehydrogenase
MKKQMMKVLIVGAGSIGEKEVRELKNHPLVKVVGLVEIDDFRRKKLEKYVPATYTDLSIAINETVPDLVRIATPPETHTELAKIALKAGKDIYIEKIMTTRIKDAEEIIDLAKSLDRKVYVRRNAIYTAVYQHAWDKLTDIGEIRHVHWIEPTQEYSFWSEYKQTWLKELPGGIISEHLPHALYTVRWFLGGEPEVGEVIFSGSELHVYLTCGRKRATISYLTPSDVPMILNVVGSKGTLYVNHSTYRVTNNKGYEDSVNPIVRTFRADMVDIFGAVWNLLRLSGHFFIRIFNVNPSSIYSKSDNYRQFTDIAKGGTTGGKFRIDGEEGLLNVELFEKIWRKAGEITDDR